MFALLKFVCGLVAGALAGAVVAVILAGVWFFGIYPMFHRVSWDGAIGLGLAPLFAAPFGAVVGVAFGAVWGLRWARSS